MRVPCLILLTFFASCMHKSSRHEVVPVRYEAYRNVIYGMDTIQQSMDVYLPEGRGMTTTPVVILLHGGGWVMGDKSEMDGAGIDSFFTAMGFAVVNMNYRLVNPYHYPDALEDIGMVMDHLKAKAKEWQIDMRRVCLMGRSAGGHLGMLYAYSRNKENRVKAVLDFYGPTDLTDNTVVNKPLSIYVTNLLGEYTTHSEEWLEASPLSYISSAVPTAIFHGTKDSLVYYTQAERLADSLQAHGVPYLLNPWTNAGHWWEQSEWLRCREMMVSWVKQHMQP